MATSNRDQSFPRIQRWLIDKVTPLEIWDVTIEARTLWEWQREESFPEVLSLALEQLTNGIATTPDKRPIKHIPIEYEHLYITGGASQSPALRKKFINADFSGSPIFGACESGLNYWDHALAIDVGQTQIKVAYENERITIPRDFKRLPVRGPSSYASLLDFIKGALPNIKPQNVILALPCHISPDLNLGDSSYAKMGGSPLFLKDLSQAYPESTWHVINDAELATLCAPDRGENRTLVLTLGFGVGACLLNHRG